MEEKKYLSLKERQEQKKQERKEQKQKEREEKKKIKIATRGNRVKRRLIFLVILITLFCVSFSTTAYIIINANKLGNKTALMEKIEKLEDEIEKKEEEIQQLTVKMIDESKLLRQLKQKQKKVQPKQRKKRKQKLQ